MLRHLGELILILITIALAIFVNESVHADPVLQESYLEKVSFRSGLRFRVQSPKDLKDVKPDAQVYRITSNNNSVLLVHYFTQGDWAEIGLSPTNADATFVKSGSGEAYRESVNRILLRLTRYLSFGNLSYGLTGVDMGPDSSVHRLLPDEHAYRVVIEPDQVDGKDAMKLTITRYKRAADLKSKTVDHEFELVLDGVKNNIHNVEQVVFDTVREGFLAKTEFLLAHRIKGLKKKLKDNGFTDLIARLPRMPVFSSRGFDTREAYQQFVEVRYEFYRRKPCEGLL